LTLKKESLLITKFVFSAAITLGAALALATPVSANPSSFGALGCSCTRPIDIPQGKLPVKNQVDRGIQSGLGSLHGGPPNPGLGGQPRVEM
jgi:hypothetical protein